MAKNYIDNLSEEVKKGHREKAEEGGWPTFAPIGYVNVLGPEGKRVVVLDNERAALVARAFEWYATGEFSVKEVAQMARRAGLSFRKSGRPISTAKVHQMLRQRCTPASSYGLASCTAERTLRSSAGSFGPGCRTFSTTVMPATESARHLSHVQVADGSLLCRGQGGVERCEDRQ